MSKLFPQEVLVVLDPEDEDNEIMTASYNANHLCLVNAQVRAARYTLVAEGTIANSTVFSSHVDVEETAGEKEETEE